MSGERKAPSSIHQLLLPALGAVILLIGVGLVAVTEKSQIDYQTQMRRHGGDVLDLGTSGRPDSEQQGYMVRVVGDLQVVESPLDQQFDQKADDPILIRHVQMFQWHETQFEQPPTYELDWEDKPVDSSHFVHSEGHTNPPGPFPIQSQEFYAGAVRLNDFMVSPTLLHALSGSDSVAPDLRSLPSNLAASFSLYDGHLVTSAVPSNPQVGDIRVGWEAVPTQTVTVVAKVDGNKLIPASDAQDGVGYAVQVGDVPLADIFPDLPVPPEFRWFRDVIGLLLAMVGVALLVHWHYDRIDPVLAPAIAMVVVGAVTAVMWLGNDITLVGEWAGLALVGAVLTAWRVRALRSHAS
jgi:hypothetical protein